MSDVTSLNNLAPATPETVSPPAASPPAADRPVRRKPKAEAKEPEGSDLDLQALLARNRELESQLAEAKDQNVKLKAAKAGEIDTSTTTTKPTLRFEVTDNKGGSAVYSVVDESEAKRLHCAVNRIEPSDVMLKVRCLDQPERNKRVFRQYEQSGQLPDRMPGVDGSFIVERKRAIRREERIATAAAIVATTAVAEDDDEDDE